jgi:hypothetical protein
LAVRVPVTVAGVDVALRPDTVSPWSFPPERMTIFRLAVALGTGDPGAALRAAAGTSAVWEPGGPHVPAAWAQIRICAGIAHLLRDEIEGTAEQQITPMLVLPPRIPDRDRHRVARRSGPAPLGRTVRP